MTQAAVGLKALGYSYKGRLRGLHKTRYQIWPAEDILRASLHGLEHLLLALMPTVALCDRRDLGSHCIAHFDEHGVARVYIYDFHHGGIGLAERGHRQIVRLLARAYDVVTQCECESGCPYCIQANWCYEENACLDKEATIYLLGRLLNRPTAVPQPPSALAVTGNP